MKLGMQHWGLKFYKSGINDDLRLTLTYFTAWSKLDTCEFEWEVCYKVIKLEKLQMTKLTEDLYLKTFLPQGAVCSCPGAIYVCMIIFFKQVFSKPLGQSRPNLLWSPLGKREREFCVK